MADRKAYPKQLPPNWNSDVDNRTYGVRGLGRRSHQPGSTSGKTREARHHGNGLWLGRNA